MKLQKNKRTIKDKIYYQFEITIPPALVEAMEFEGKELVWKVEGKGKLMLLEK